MSFKEKLSAGEFVKLVELEPPKGVDVSGYLENAARIKGAVDALAAPEMSNAVMKMSSLGAAMLLQGKGMEAVMQICCRDRNRLALQADILAAAALGVGGLMAVEGDSITHGDHHRARPVHDLELQELLEVIQKLQAGKDMAGIELDGAPKFTVGSAINPGAAGGAARELETLRRRLETGVEFFITPPVFDLSVFQAFKEQADQAGARIIPTVWILKSVGMARAIDLHVKHVHMPPELMTRIKKAPDRVKECLRIAVETIDEIRKAGYAGVMIAPLGWEDKLPRILDKIQ